MDLEALHSKGVSRYEKKKAAIVVILCVEQIVRRSSCESVVVLDLLRVNKVRKEEVIVLYLQKSQKLAVNLFIALEPSRHDRKHRCLTQISDTR